MTDVYEEYNNLSKEDLEKSKTEIEYNIGTIRNQMLEENMKFENYKVTDLAYIQIENERRQHNYIPLIFELLKIMAEKNVLEPVYTTAKADMEKKKSDGKQDNKILYHLIEL